MRIRCPRILACSMVRILARRSSRISSSMPSKPALKNTCRQRCENGVKHDRESMGDMTCQTGLSSMYSPKWGCSEQQGTSPGSVERGTAGHHLSLPCIHPHIFPVGPVAALGGMSSGSSTQTCFLLASFCFLQSHEGHATPAEHRASAELQ